MDFRDILLNQYSKRKTLEIVNFINNDTVKFKELMNLFLGTDLHLAQRASWPLNYSAIQYPDLVKPYRTKLINNLLKPNIQTAVKRNTMRIFEDIDIPQHSIAVLTDICFKYIADFNEAIAVRAFAITVLNKIVQIEPALNQEFIALLQMIVERDKSPAVLSRARKILKRKQML